MQCFNKYQTRSISSSVWHGNPRTLIKPNLSKMLQSNVQYLFPNKIVVTGLCGTVLVVGGSIGVAPVRSCEKLPSCLIKPVPAGSKTDSLLAKAKPISNVGSASGIT